MKYKNAISAAAVFLLAAAAFITPLSHATEQGEIKKRLASLKTNIEYLSARHIDTADYIKRLAEIEKNIAEYEKAQTETEAEGQVENNPLLPTVIELSITSLDREVTDKTGSVKRLDVLYIVMLVFGALTGIGFALYIVVMYNKRK